MNIANFKDLISVVKNSTVPIHMERYAIKQGLASEVDKHPFIDPNYCGTPACAVGTYLIEQGYRPVFTSVFDDCTHLFQKEDYRVHADQWAKDFLEVGETLFNRLFVIDTWPLAYRSHYCSAQSDLDRRNAVVARLEHYLETGE